MSRREPSGHGQPQEFPPPPAFSCPPFGSGCYRSRTGSGVQGALCSSVYDQAQYTGVSLSGLSMVPSEEEVLLPPCSCFEVLSKFRDAHGLVIVQMKQITSALELLPESGELWCAGHQPIRAFTTVFLGRFHVLVAGRILDPRAVLPPHQEEAVVGAVGRSSVIFCNGSEILYSFWIYLEILPTPADFHKI